VLEHRNVWIADGRGTLKRTLLCVQCHGFRAASRLSHTCGKNAQQRDLLQPSEQAVNNRNPAFLYRRPMVHFDPVRSLPHLFIPKLSV